MNETIEFFAKRLLLAKQHEQNAKQNRLQAESKLVKAMANDKLEGTKTMKNDNVTASVTNKLNRKLDHDAYLEIQDKIPTGCNFVEYEPKINLTNLRHIEAVMPGFSAQCITTKPAKPTVKVEVVL